MPRSLYNHIFLVFVDLLICLVFYLFALLVKLFINLSNMTNQLLFNSFTQEVTASWVFYMCSSYCLLVKLSHTFIQNFADLVLDPFRSASIQMAAAGRVLQAIYADLC